MALTATEASSVPNHHLVLFTKPAVPGLVKTRLQQDDGSGGPVLNAEEAANLHLAFLHDTSKTLESAAERLAVGGRPATVSIAWALAPEGQKGSKPEPGFERFAGFEQVGMTLGDRLLHGLRRSQSRVSEKTAADVLLAVGSDHPELSEGGIFSAITAIEEGADLAISPAEDGGYTFIALRRKHLVTELFDGIAWSTETVLAETVERAAKLGLTVRHLASGFDCDTPSDLQLLIGRLAEAATTDHQPCAHTRRELVACGLLQP